jgi:hypothetical protein
MVETRSLKDILEVSMNSAIKGGSAGALAMGANIGCLMWLRTTMNYQYLHGTSFNASLKTLYGEGGVRRFYRGMSPALVQGPLCRFGDTASNAGVLTFMNSCDNTRDIPVIGKTLVASSVASVFRVGLMPIDSCKVNLQMHGSMTPLLKKFHKDGIRVLYNGSVASASATFVGHYPWFATYNYLSERIREREGLSELGRRALIGFSSSFVSDTTSNSLRVIKVTKQGYQTNVSYPEIIGNIIRTDGVAGLMFRGLETRILANGLQGVIFTVCWKYFEDVLR